MSRVFKRPMFRRGGNVGSGIMTGIVDRSMHAKNPFVTGNQGMKTDFGKEAEILNQTYDNNSFVPYPPTEQEIKDTSPILTTEDARKMPADLFPKPDFGTEQGVDYFKDKIMAGAGEYGGMDPLTSFLLTAGPAITNATSFGDAVSKLGPANKALIEQADKKAEYLRNIGLKASEMSLANAEKIEGRKYNYGVNLSDKQYAYASNINEQMYNEKATGVQWAREALKQKEKMTREDYITQQAAILSKASAADAKDWELIMAKNNLKDEVALIKQKAESQKSILASERDLRLGDDKKALITDRIVKSMEEDRDMSYATAENEAKWIHGNNTKYRDQGKIGFVLTEAHLKDTVAYAEKQVKKGAGDGSIHYDPVDNKVYQVQKDGEGGHNLVEVFETGSSGSTKQKDEKSIIEKESQGDKEIIKLTPQAVGFDNKPVFESLAEVRSVMEFPMTGQEMIDKYEIPESLWSNISKKQTYKPILPGASAYQEGNRFDEDNPYKVLQSGN